MFVYNTVVLEVTVTTAVLLVVPDVAVIVTTHEIRNDRVVIEKVADVAPAGTVTLPGTVVTSVLFVFSVTTTPPVGAALVSVTVPVTAVPPLTLVGLIVNAETVTTVSVRVAVLLTEL